MHYASFELNGISTWGSLEAGMLRPVSPDDRSRFPSLRAAISANGGAVPTDIRYGSASPLAEARLLPPIPAPSKIVCVGRNYGAHVREIGAKPPEHPSLFTRFVDTLVPSGDALERPSMSVQLDFEGEVAVIIGRPGRDIAPESAMKHVFGYSLFNDASVRDVQLGHSLAAGKNFFRTGGFGPTILTADAVPDYRALRLATRVNGVVMQDASLEEMIFDVPNLIAYISRITPLAGGDVILTGTPEGVGLFREPPLWLAPGDVVEVEVPEIGRLTNGVADPADGSPA